MSGPLARFVARRIAAAVAFVLIVATSAMLLVRLAPGDATSGQFWNRASQQSIEATRHRVGLDQPPLVQAAHWLGGLLRGDLGESQYGQPVAELVMSGMGQTARLAALALVLAAVVGLPLGMITGTRPRSMLSHVVSVVSIALLCCPPIIGTLALLFLGASTGWLSVSPGHYALPTLALALPLAAMLERLQSQAASDAVGSPDIAAAAARGVPPARLVWLHAGRQALRPVLGVAGIVVATLFSGSVAVETITQWPGLGQLMLQALTGRDLPLVAGCAMAGAALLALANLAADVLRAVVDPRAASS